MKYVLKTDIYPILERSVETNKNEILYTKSAHTHTQLQNGFKTQLEKQMDEE